MVELQDELQINFYSMPFNAVQSSTNPIAAPMHIPTTTTVEDEEQHTTPNIPSKAHLPPPTPLGSTYYSC